MNSNRKPRDRVLINHLIESFPCVEILQHFPDVPDSLHSVYRLVYEVYKLGRDWSNISMDFGCFLAPLQ